MPYDPRTSIYMSDALRNGDVQEVMRLIDLENINAPYQSGESDWRPLHTAALYGKDALCKVLLAHGADPNVQMTHQGLTPLHCIMYANLGAGFKEDRFACFVMLLEAGANPNLAGPALSPTVLHHMINLFSIRSGGNRQHIRGAERDRGAATKAIRMLLEKGADPSFVPAGLSKDGDYLTPFESAIKKGLPDIVRLFLETGRIDLAQRTVGDKTLFQLTKNVEIKEMIRSTKIEQGVRRGIEVIEGVSGNSKKASFSPL